MTEKLFDNMVSFAYKFQTIFTIPDDKIIGYPKMVIGNSRRRL
jgi:hypothetical protein